MGFLAGTETKFDGHLSPTESGSEILRFQIVDSHQNNYIMGCNQTPVSFGARNCILGSFLAATFFIETTGTGREDPWLPPAT